MIVKRVYVVGHEVQLLKAYFQLGTTSRIENQLYLRWLGQ